MLSATYSVIVVVLEDPLSRSNVWPEGDFDDYSKAEMCAKSIVENVLLHLEASLHARGQQVTASNLMTAYLQEGEAPIITGAGDLSQRFDFWAYATQRAAILTNDDGSQLDRVATPKIVLH